MEPSVPETPLAHHELHDNDARIDLWHIAKHTLGEARSLVAHALKGDDGQWTVWTASPAQTAQYTARASAWEHIYGYALAREQTERPSQSHAEPLTEQQG